MLKSKRRLLKEFMYDKSDFLEELTDISLYEKDDYDWVDTLTYREIKFILVHLDNGEDDRLCPQCILYSMNCSHCPYKDLHGRCDHEEEDSTYSLLIAELETTAIVSLYFLYSYELTKWNKMGG